MTTLLVLPLAQAAPSGGLFGNGFGHGGWRNSGLPYMQTDYAFSLVGEELGLFGSLVVLGLLLAFLWYALQLVLSVRDRFSALAAFGLVVVKSVWLGLLLAGLLVASLALFLAALYVQVWRQRRNARAAGESGKAESAEGRVLVSHPTAPHR